MPAMSQANAVVCQHASCDDDADTTVDLEDGQQYDLCEDHAHMNPDGSPVDGYEPNDPEKFSHE